MWSWWGVWEHPLWCVQSVVMVFGYHLVALGFGYGCMPLGGAVVHAHGVVLALLLNDLDTDATGSLGMVCSVVRNGLPRGESCCSCLPQTLQTTWTNTCCDFYSLHSSAAAALCILTSTKTTAVNCSGHTWA
jgi:hypothetical protein